MSTIRDTDTLLINRAGASFHVEAQNFANVRDSDLLLVNRGGESFKCSKADVDNIRDDDLLLVNRAGASFKVTGAQFKEDLIGGGGAVTISTWGGNFSPRTIVDGTDYQTNGGLVIIKGYGGSVEGWRWWSVPYNATIFWDSSTNDALRSPGNGVTSFNTDGYSIGTDSAINTNSSDYIGYGFVPTPGVFDVQSYTTVGNQTHPHNLGVVPEMIITKGDVLLADWYVYHKDTPNSLNSALKLNLTDVYFSQNGIWQSGHTATHYSIGGNAFAGSSGTRHNAYLFASKPGVSKCGSYKGNGTTNPIDCGFEPGFVLIRSVNSGDWVIYDSLRSKDVVLNPNNALGQQNTTNQFEFTSNGFQLNTSNPNMNTSNVTYVYFACTITEGQTTFSSGRLLPGAPDPLPSWLEIDSEPAAQPAPNPEPEVEVEVKPEPEATTQPAKRRRKKKAD